MTWGSVDEDRGRRRRARPFARGRCRGCGTALSQSQPRVQRKVGPSMAVIAAVLADAVGDGVLVGNTGMRLR